MKERGVNLRIKWINLILAESVLGNVSRKHDRKLSTTAVRLGHKEIGFDHRQLRSFGVGGLCALAAVP